MKKCTTILLLSAMLLSLLSACHSRVNYPADVFYSDELLASCLMARLTLTMWQRLMQIMMASVTGGRI